MILIRLGKGRLRKRQIMLFFVITFIFVLFAASVSSSLLFVKSHDQPRVVFAEIVEESLRGMSPAGGYVEEFKPTIWKPFWVDRKNNGIADSLDQEIAEKMANGTAGDYVNVIVALKREPTAYDANTFAVCGGYITTSSWKYAIYGFGGQIPYNRILDFVQRDPNVLLVEREAVAHAMIAYAASQVGARTYVWNALGLQGDPNSSIAILDTGIDDSHPDFSPGFGNQNFTRKIVGWNDQINPGTTSPYDDEGHGSHVAGLAAGSGFFSTDTSGNANATWGAYLNGLNSGTYYISGMMINKTGLITINMKWKNSWFGTLDTLHLYYANKTLNAAKWTEVASVNPTNQEEWYTLTYNVTSTPSGGYDMYHILMSFTAATPFLEDFYVVYTMSWPYSPPADGFPAWTGIAPEAKLVGVKVMDSTGYGTDTGLLNAIDWVIANKEDYHIVIVSMSLGFSSEVASVDAAVRNLVNSGITTIVSAGNSGAGSNNIYTPGSVDEVIAVAATNQFDNIASYSSQGGISRYTGNTVKPDIAAPGGSFFAVPLQSADSNDGEAGLGWPEVTLDDAAPMQGTSMSAPVVAGAANIIIQAMGGFANWQYTRSQALLPKMFMLMTATETYPNFREYSSYTWEDPSLERGGKDVHEGYGRMNLDVAVDAILQSYEIGASVDETLGKPPTPSNISALGQKLAWARNVQLVPGWEYNFTLAIPAGADFDLYLYNNTGTRYGEPAIVAKSTTAAVGGYEQLIVNAPYNGTYYLVVKRATANTEGGTFTLQSTFAPLHDVAVLSVEPFANSVFENNTLNITVTVKNEGLSNESFNVTVLYGNITISKQEVVDLAADTALDLTFYWNTTSVTPNMNYTLSARADAVAGELEISDNNFVDGEVFVKIAGDANGDGKVDIFDIYAISAHWYPGPPAGILGYNYEIDINDDGAIDIYDLRIANANWGRTG